MNFIMAVIVFIIGSCNVVRAPGFAIACVIVSGIFGIAYGMERIASGIQDGLQKPIYGCLNRPIYSSMSTDVANQSQNIYKRIPFKNELDAERALSKIYELIEKNGLIRVSDVFDITGEPHTFTDTTYAWLNHKDFIIEKTGVISGWKYEIIIKTKPTKLKEEK